MQPFRVESVLHHSAMHEVLLLRLINKAHLRSESGAIGIAPTPIPIKNIEVAAVAAICEHPNSSIIPCSAAEDTELANVKDSVKKAKSPITKVL